MYLEALGRSFDAKRVTELRSVVAVRDLLGSCRLPCHRFVGGDDFLARAKEHSLRARVAEAKAISALPSSMRLTEMIQLVIRRRSTVTAVNAALCKRGSVRSTPVRWTTTSPGWVGSPRAIRPPERAHRPTAQRSLIILVSSADHFMIMLGALLIVFTASLQRV